MERIKQALERARAERDRAGRDGPAAAAPTAQVAPTPVPLTSRQTAPIEYTHTRRIEVPDRRLRRRRVIAGADDTALSAAYKVLRTQVLHRLRLNGWNTVAVTSPGSGDGKTLTAVNLAVALAKEVNHTVLLVDLDLRQPAVHRHFDLTPALGISDYLLHDAAIPDILVNPGLDGLVILPGRERITQSSEAMSSPKMVQLVEELKARYPTRIVIFDLPPLLAGDDTIAFAPYVDAVLLVARESKTRRDELTMAAELLDGTPLLGTVLNESEEKTEAYY